MHPRTRLVYFYFFRVNFLVKASTSGRCDQVWLPWQRCICRSRYGCFCLSPQVTYLHTKIERGLKFFISNFASLSWRIALNILPCKVFCPVFYLHVLVKWVIHQVHCLGCPIYLQCHLHILLSAVHCLKILFIIPSSLQRSQFSHRVRVLLGLQKWVYLMPKFFP